ncbi:MAG: recombinase family protein [Proteobacteria bacterium]|nr:recombinase family protein [Pseudomonadota bacterium]
MISELVTTQHLANKAIIYVRQSTPHQTLSNQESLELQYALKQKAVELGWPSYNVEIIDADLGLTGASTDHREGFKEILTRVALGQIGIILSYDVTRLSRNCSDWYPLLDLCGYRHCLIADRDGVYDPGTVNGRLLLGLKGQLAEVELNTIRARLTAGLLNKAQRGDLALRLPIGLVRNSHNLVQKDPNLEVQNLIVLIFGTFLRLKSASKTMQYFNEKEFCLPRYDGFHELHWKKPTVSAIISTLKNPAYAGAFAYGRSRVIRSGPSPTDKSIKKVPQQEWKVLVQNKYPGYIDWETFEKIQTMLKDNYAEYDRNKTRGVPRPGEALLHGIIYCGECGHKMLIQYKKGTQYLCNALRQQYGTPVCQRIPGNPIDIQVVKTFFQAISSIELDAYTQSLALQTQEDSSVQRSHLQQLERFRYLAKLAERQFNQVDPDNRLVASELEKRWENALKDLRQAEESFVRQKSKTPVISLPEELRLAFMSVEKNLPKLWDKTVSQQQKKSFLRCLIDKVVIHRSEPDNIHTRIVWKGGDTTTIKIPITVGSLARLSFAKEMEEKIIELSQTGMKDKAISDYLTNNGFRSPMSNEVLLNTVKIVRLKHRIFLNRSQSHPRCITGFLTIGQLSQITHIPVHWIYDRIHNGRIEVKMTHLAQYKKGLYLFPDALDTINMFHGLRNGHFQNLRFS